MSLMPRNNRDTENPRKKKQRDPQTIDEMFTLNLTREQLFIIVSSLNEYKTVLEKLAAYEDIAVSPDDVAPVVHGHWIEITTDVYQCSKCTQLVRTKDIVPYRFCNVCGAKMDEKADNNVRKTKI